MMPDFTKRDEMRNVCSYMKYMEWNSRLPKGVHPHSTVDLISNCLLSGVSINSCFVSTGSPWSNSSGRICICQRSHEGQQTTCMVSLSINKTIVKKWKWENTTKKDNQSKQTKSWFNPESILSFTATIYASKKRKDSETNPFIHCLISSISEYHHKTVDSFS